jgi:hypothetical protein
MAEPGERISWANQRRSRTYQQRWGDKIGRSSVAEGTGMLRVSGGVDDLKWMQRRMANLYKQ